MSNVEFRIHKTGRQRAVSLYEFGDLFELGMFGGFQ